MLSYGALENVVDELRLVMEATGLTHADQLHVLTRLIEKMGKGKALCAACHMLVAIGQDDGGGPRVPPRPSHRAACSRWCMPGLVDRSLVAEPIHEDVETCEGCLARDTQFINRPVITSVAR